MNRNRVQTVGELLRAYYGRAGEEAGVGQWKTLLSTVLVAGDAQPRDVGKFATWVAATFLVSPVATFESTVDDILVELRPVSKSRPKAAVLKSLATWWRGRLGDETEVPWDGSPYDYREELIRIRGLGSEVVDRLLLEVGGFAVFPIGRNAMRLAGRHGWLGPEAEYEEWQALFVGDLANGADSTGLVELRELAVHVAKLGKDYCGVRPDCDACPLNSLLPPGGPLEPDDQ